MAPYRNRAARRERAAQIDHDVFDGLPIRHWRRTPQTFGVPPKPADPNASSNSENAWPELPMPKEAGLLSPMSRALLRAARMGRVVKPKEEKGVGDELKDVDGEKNSSSTGAGETEAEPSDPEKGFLLKRWSLVPKEHELPEPEFLAKRRKGLLTVYGSVALSTGSMKKAKVRRIDAEGNTYVWEVLVPEGQTIEGEIIEEEPLRGAPAPGDVVEGVGIVNSEGVVVPHDEQPIRKRPKPPRRKPKGPGRGRKKKVDFVPPRPQTSVTTTTEQPDVNVKMVKQEDTGSQVNAVKRDGDTEMGDADEEGTSNDEDEEGDDSDKEEGELSESSHSPSTSPAKLPPKRKSISQAPEPILTSSAPIPSLPPPTAPPGRELSSSPDLPLALQSQQRIQPDQPDLPDAPATDLEVTRVSPQPPTAEVTEFAAPPAEEKITVASPPKQSPSDATKATLPEDHNPLEGLTAPEPGTVAEDTTTATITITKIESEPKEDVPVNPKDDIEMTEADPDQKKEDVGGDKEKEKDVHFSDGDVDLFGSLEAHLAEAGGTGK
ncbi:MAG: hypothetical protein M1834_005326 [Cirrosporium novae-zelandiae]|nr:MAG: hypothetical protein M1834_005326 [Cirrosporium novae-zelandiae]